jgi:cystathionine beta-lyase/cystathionine gamma-synthase
VDTSDPRSAAPEGNHSALFVESLTNPLLKTADISALAGCAASGVLCIVDNTP